MALRPPFAIQLYPIERKGTDRPIHPLGIISQFPKLPILPPIRVPLYIDPAPLCLHLRQLKPTKKQRLPSKHHTECLQFHKGLALFHGVLDPNIAQDDLDIGPTVPYRQGHRTNLNIRKQVRLNRLQNTLFQAAGLIPNHRRQRQHHRNTQRQYNTPARAESPPFGAALVMLRRSVLMFVY